LYERVSKACFSKRMKYNKKKPTEGRSFISKSSPINITRKGCE